MNELLYELGRWTCVLGSLIVGVWAFRAFTRHARSQSARLACRRCGYDVTQTPEQCPECGTRVPDEMRLRIDLLAGRIPDYLLNDDQALPLREPEPGEPVRPLAIIPDPESAQRLLTLLRRAGIWTEVDVMIGPDRPHDLFRPRVPRELSTATNVRVPVDDYPVAMELLGQVRRETEAPKA